MKNTARPFRPSLLLEILALVALVALFAAAPQALAQEAAASAPASAPAVASTPWWAGTEIITAVIALVTGVIAVWKNEQKKTAQKVSETLVIAIEAATKIPAVADKEKEIKAKIREKTEALGVEPLVNRLVKDLT